MLCFVKNLWKIFFEECKIIFKKSLKKVTTTTDPWSVLWMGFIMNELPEWKYAAMSSKLTLWSDRWRDKNAEGDYLGDNFKKVRQQSKRFDRHGPPFISIKAPKPRTSFHWNLPNFQSQLPVLPICHYIQVWYWNEAQCFGNNNNKGLWLDGYQFFNHGTGGSFHYKIIEK